MDPTLQALVNLLIDAVPTILLFIFLLVFLNQVFFKPVSRILEQRREQTEGVRAISEQAFRDADQKQSEFERALQLARQEIAKENEQRRQQWVREANERIAQARATADQKREAARQQIRQETEQAQQAMADRVDALAETVVSSLLGRRAA